MAVILAWWNSHGTKILGFVGGTIACLAGVEGIIPPDKLKYAMGLIALCTFWRGFTNTRAADNATVAEHAARDHTGTDEVQ